MPEAIIEIAIGLFLVFTLMSLLASQLVEWLAAFRGWRARDLENTIRTMLFEPKVKGQINAGALRLADELYKHPLIASLTKYGGKPSYIPADKFVLALFDVIATAGSETSTIARARVGLDQIKNQLLAALPQSAGPELDSLLEQIQIVIEQARFAGQTADAIAALPLPSLLSDQLNGFLNRYGISLDAFNTLMQPLAPGGDIVLNQVIGGAVRLAQLRPQLSQIVTSLFSGLDAQLAAGEPRLAAARQNFEQWFNDTMDRAAGGYKRHTQFWLALIGFLFALALNVDTVTIATTLWGDPTLRQNVVIQAQNFQPTSTPITNPDEAAQAVRDLSTKLSQDLRLPIGWRIEPYHPQAGEVCTLLPQKTGDVWGIPYGPDCVQVLEAVPNPTFGVISKLLGFIITAAAVSQGAPFWFDLLQKVSNMRLAGKKPE